MEISNTFDALNVIFYQASETKARTTQTKVLVVSGGKNMLDERLKLVNELWNGGIEVPFRYSLDIQHFGR